MVYHFGSGLSCASQVSLSFVSILLFKQRTAIGNPNPVERTNRRYNHHGDFIPFTAITAGEPTITIKWYVINPATQCPISTSQVPIMSATNNTNPYIQLRCLKTQFFSMGLEYCGFCWLFIIIPYVRLCIHDSRLFQYIS